MIARSEEEFELFMVGSISISDVGDFEVSKPEPTNPPAVSFLLAHGSGPTPGGRSQSQEETSSDGGGRYAQLDSERRR